MIQGKNLVKTKIIATLGPSSSEKEVIKSLVEEGVNVFRLNFSHGTYQEHLEKIKIIREIERTIGFKVTILQDLQGPKIRLGKFKGGHAFLTEGDKFVITSEDIEGDKNISSITFPNVIKDIKKDERIFINDGLVKLVVKNNEGNLLITEVIEGGEVSDHKGLNFPDSEISLDSISNKDIDDLKFGLENGIDLIAISFVKNAKDITKLRDLMKRFGRTVPIVSKIERWEAVKNIKEIASISDAIMVARGDLGIELPIQKIPIIQKEIISLCNLLGKPVITATQMLSSLVENLTPTRAEVTDIANSIFDGTDAVMLSNETAVGRHPVKAVTIMRNIIEETEQSSIFKEQIKASKDFFENNISDAIAYSSTEVAQLTKANLIICATESGKTATLISKHKPSVPILALTPKDETLRFLNLKWGVYPCLVQKFQSVDEILEEGPKVAVNLGLVKDNDIYVIVAGSLTGISGSTNLLKVDKV